MGHRGGQGDRNGAEDSSNTVFGAFDDNLAGYLDELSAADLGRPPSGGADPGAVAALLGGLAAAVLGRSGVAERLREYR